MATGSLPSPISLSSLGRRLIALCMKLPVLGQSRDQSLVLAQPVVGLVDFLEPLPSLRLGLTSRGEPIGVPDLNEEAVRFLDVLPGSPWLQFENSQILMCGGQQFRHICKAGVGESVVQSREGPVLRPTSRAAYRSSTPTATRGSWWTWSSSDLPVSCSSPPHLY